MLNIVNCWNSAWTSLAVGNQHKALSTIPSYNAMMIIMLVVETDNGDNEDADCDDDDDDDDNDEDNNDDDDYKGDNCRAGFASQLHSLQSRRWASATLPSGFWHRQEKRDD